MLNTNKIIKKTLFFYKIYISR